MERGFCRECGTPLTFRYVEQDRICVSIGSLDEPGRIRPEIQYGIESRLGFPDSAPARGGADGGLRDTDGSGEDGLPTASRPRLGRRAADPSAFFARGAKAHAASTGFRPLTAHARTASKYFPIGTNRKAASDDVAKIGPRILAERHAVFRRGARPTEERAQ